MKKLLLVDSLICLNSFIVCADAVSISTKVSQSSKSEENHHKDKKMRFGFELGCRGRVDYFKLSPKTDFKTKLLALINKTNFVKVTENDFQATMTGFTNEFPNLSQTINALTDANKTTLQENGIEIARFVLKNYGDFSIDNISTQINKVCTVLNITQGGTPNAYKMLHDTNYLLIACLIIDAPTKFANNPTIDNFNSAFREVLAYKVNNDIPDDKSSTITNSDYINYDMLANFFVNYPISNRFYLTGGVGFIYDLADSKGHSFYGKRKNKQSNSSTTTTNSSLDVYYQTKYALVPSLGIGVQFSKHFAIEILGFDQITRVGINLSNFYKSADWASLSNAISGFKTLMPEQQKNWVNRFGVELDLKFIINDKFFVKTGLFYIPQTNLFRKIQPIDFNCLSAGAKFSIGLTT